MAYIEIQKAMKIEEIVNMLNDGIRISKCLKATMMNRTYQKKCNKQRYKNLNIRLKNLFHKGNTG